MASQKRKRSPDQPSSDASSLVFRSSPIEDRSSTFIGYFSPTIPPETLQKLPEIKDATHKILAYRRESPQRSLTGRKQYTAGHDDDGEKYAGKRVEKALEAMQVVGACVVARWYGGVMLGPVRFTHIEECARDAVRRWQASVAEEGAKKRRVEEEGVEQGRLAAALRERDSSIAVLRDLAAVKERQVKEGIVAGVEALDGEQQIDGKSPKPGDGAGSRSKPSNAVPAIDYSVMPVERLRVLDRARDATLSFLLKRIDKAEADLTALRNDQEAK
ncbi:hypothetical protein B0A50_08047 [Salinomyces thailandicus]|uniref:Impact N-terminal domain-containing protein n=1 Tax=Salinomyces thailandicus TaxID=706561 RepID=A0A4U0TKT6_9PEZI|nr:hypothetical protein B0A50_08047 [Salinomyces thailandica]